MFEMATAADNFGIALSDSEFREFRDIVKQTTGINLSDTKKALVISRLARRLRELNIQTFITYIHRLRKDTNELLFMINRITTNLTRFYREKGQFDILRHTVLPEILEEKKKSLIHRERTNGPEQKLRIWSAGCSSGEEVYTILFETLEYFGGRLPAGLDLKILGSDIDTNVLEKARTGEYTAEEMNGVDAHILARYFRSGAGGGFRVRDHIRPYVSFSRLNLVYDAFQFKNPIDIIFCRNVVIYFNRETKSEVYHKFYQVLSHPGYLFSGHSENLFPYADMFSFVKKSVYKKIE